ncbi:unnamed protein product [Linum trigynum]|uniref:Uncharacterized protein n=1 Tax=Linum trigynum TaxID=586398 RepID=A0AAV2GM82_9ROSI
MGELLHGEESKSRIRHGIHTAKDGFRLLDVDWHFSKLELASNGVEDQSRALGNSCSSLSLSRNRSISQKLESPSVWLKICLKGHQPKHGRGHGRVMPQPARALASVNYTASALGETRPCFGGTRPCFGRTRPCFVLALPV